MPVRRAEPGPWAAAVTLWLCLFQGLGITPDLVAQGTEPAAEQVPRQQESVVEILARLASASPAYGESYSLEGLAEDIRASTDLEEKRRLAFLLGRAFLLIGRTEDSIQVFEEMQASARRGPRLRPEYRRQLRENLAVAYLRLAEQDNCVSLHASGSCIFPLQEEARHRIERGSLQAMRQLTLLLEEEPDLGYRWLLNLAAMTLGKYPGGVPERLRIPEQAFASDFPLPRFRDQAAAAGLDVLGTSGGVVLEDFDGDGFLDLMASAWGPKEQLRLFKNQGDGTFTERTEAAGLAGQTGGLNLVHADYDNDGDADVLVLRGAWQAARFPNSLLQNQGDGSFVDVTIAAGLLSFFPTQTAAWADFDGDGWLDLFIGNESDQRLEAPSELYRNRGDGSFEEVAAQAGLAVRGFVKAVAWGDVDNDGRPDLYLSRFGEANTLYRNDGPREGGGWRFVEMASRAGVEAPINSFSSWFWDFDNDGNQDLLVAPFAGFFGDSLTPAVAALLGQQVEGVEAGRLYRGLGDGTFEDRTRQVGLGEAMLAMGANFGDLDNDGFLDAYFGTGEPSLKTLVPNRMFRNADGRTFQDVTTAGGFGHLQKGHGIAFADLDNDGDEDIYAVMGGAFSGDVYQNSLFVNPGNKHPWLALELQGTESNRGAIGARLAVHVKDPAGSRVIHRTIGTGGSFGSSSLRQEIGLGPATAITKIVVRWPLPGAPTQTFTGLEPRRFYLLTEGQSTASPLTRTSFTFPATPASPTAHHGHSKP